MQMKQLDLEELICIFVRTFGLKHSTKKSAISIMDNKLISEATNHLVNMEVFREKVVNKHRGDF